MKRPALLTPRGPLALADLSDALFAFTNTFLSKRLGILRRWIEQPDNLYRLQQRDQGLPGESGIDNLPDPYPRQPEPSGCLSAITRLFSRLGRKR